MIAVFAALPLAFSSCTDELTNQIIEQVLTDNLPNMLQYQMVSDLSEGSYADAVAYLTEHEFVKTDTLNGMSLGDNAYVLRGLTTAYVCTLDSMENGMVEELNMGYTRLATTQDSVISKFRLLVAGADGYFPASGALQMIWSVRASFADREDTSMVFYSMAEMDQCLDTLSECTELNLGHMRYYSNRTMTCGVIYEPEDRYQMESISVTNAQPME